MAPLLLHLLLLGGIGHLGAVGLISIDGTFSEAYIDEFSEEGAVLAHDTESVFTTITSNGMSISMPSASNDDLKVQEALSAKGGKSRSQRSASKKEKTQLEVEDISFGHGDQSVFDGNNYQTKQDSMSRSRRESEPSHPLLVQGVDSMQSVNSALITWKGINNSVIGSSVCQRIAAFRIYRQSLWFDDVSQLSTARIGEVRIPPDRAQFVQNYRSWSEKDPPTISCLYYAVTVVCADNSGNELEYKKVQPAQPMVIVTDYVESGDAITLQSDSGQPGNPAIAQSPLTRNTLVVYDIDAYDDQSETDNKPDHVVAILLSPSGEELWGRHITHYTVKGERGRPAVVYHEAKQAFFIAYELRTKQYNDNRMLLAGCFVYENSSFTNSYPLVTSSAGNIERFDLIYNPAIRAVSVAFQIWNSNRNRYLAFIVYFKNDREVLSTQTITANATSPRLAFDKKNNELYVVVQIDKSIGLRLAKAQCSDQTVQHYNEEANRGEAAVIVLKLNGRIASQILGRPVTFGFVTLRSNGLTAYYDESRDAVAFSFTNTAFLREKFHHYMWTRTFRNVKGNLAGGSCQFQSRSSGNISLPVRHQAAVFSPLNRASFIVYEMRRPNGRWTLGTMSIAKDLERWSSTSALFPATLYDETCKCFFVCWQDDCSNVIRCHRYSPLQHGYCIGAKEAQCMARINRRPSCESWCGSHNETALSHCTACDPLQRHLLSSGKSGISSKARRMKKTSYAVDYRTGEVAYTQCPRCGCRCPNVSCRKTYIVGGTKVEPHCWPWMVYLKDVISPESEEASKSPFCGGTLINPRFVLTAAHCVAEKEARKIAVYAGKSVCRQKHPEDCEQRRLGKKVIMHEGYSDVTIVNDIAIIKLNKAFHLNQQVRTVCLPDDDCSVSTNSSVYIVGCGAKRSGSEGGTKHIKQIVEPIVSPEACRKAYPNSDGLTIINENMFCAGLGLGESDTCGGDSGGGAFIYEHSSCRFVQVGIVSWGDIICAKAGKYTVFTKVYNYLPWIKNIVNRPCN